MHRVGLFDGRGTGFADAYVANLASLDQFGHGANGVLDGHRGVDTVLIIEIKVIGVQPLQAGVDGLANVRRTAIDATRMRVIATDDAELAGQVDTFTLALEGTTKQGFVGVRAVHVSRIEKVDTQLDRAVQGGDGFLFVDAGGVEVRHSHAAQPEGGHVRTELTQLARDHNECS